jgi:hypothetical protein
MPYKDHTGPNGEGPMTGRALGDCNKDTKQVAYGERPRLGLGRGRGAGRNGGRNRRPLGQGRRSQGRF